MRTIQLKYDTGLIGAVYLVATENGLRGIYWSKQKVETVDKLADNERASRILAQTIKQLQEYFAGKRKVFDLPLDISGTDFQKKVWKQLQKIPYGSTCSYTDIARKIHNDKAVRAVGTANGRNPLSIVIPCHRVIAASGTLGGYAGGLSTKTKLLHLEGAWAEQK